MAYGAMHVPHKQHSGARHRFCIHVRHLNMEADVAVYMYHVSMPLILLSTIVPSLYGTIAFVSKSGVRMTSSIIHLFCIISIVHYKSPLT